MTGPQLHLTMLILPPGPMVKAGVKEERYTRVVPASEAGAAVAELMQAIVSKTSLLAQGATIVAMVQPQGQSATIVAQALARGKLS